MSAKATTDVLIIDERRVEMGAMVQTRLASGPDGPVMTDDRVSSSVSITMILGIMRRYGRPLDGAVMLSGPKLSVGDNMTLERLSHRARYDALPLDYIVLCTDGEPPLAVLARDFATPLRFLVQRQGERAASG